jgi:hypothetical protein
MGVFLFSKPVSRTRYTYRLASGWSFHPTLASVIAAIARLI